MMRAFIFCKRNKNLLSWNDMAKTRTTQFRIEGMHCAGCAASIEKGLNKTEGVLRAQVNFAVGSASVDFDSGTATEKTIFA